jgi:hypothetical protein
MSPILISSARMALLAVPFADPFLIGLVQAPEADALQARNNGYAHPESTATATSARPYPTCNGRPC